MPMSDSTSAELTSQQGIVSASARKSEAPCGIFYLLDSFEIGGTESQAVELALRMAQAGHRVTLGVLRAQGPLLERLRGSAVGVEIFHPRGGLDSPRGLFALFRLSRYLRRYRFDVVHTHDLWSNLMGVTAAKLAGVPVIVSSQRDLSHERGCGGFRMFRAWCW
jgi:hypothetical protein